MGVKKIYHNKGIGTLLFNELKKFASTKYDYIQVKTVDEGHYKEYDQTIAFYKKQGFKKLEVFPYTLGWVESLFGDDPKIIKHRKYYRIILVFYHYIVLAKKLFYIIILLGGKYGKYISSN